MNLCSALSPAASRILAHVHTAHNRAFLATVYACGLRLQEALYLEVGDIDSARMMIHVHRGKGAKDRYVPLPHASLARLRAHWCSHRNPPLLFPAWGRDSRSAGAAQTPMAKSSVQGAFRRAKAEAGIRKRGVSVHTLRHYADIGIGDTHSRRICWRTVTTLERCRSCSAIPALKQR